MTEAKAELKTLTDWVLVCYDLPASAKHARAQFIVKAIAAGAMQYTESVYLMPYSPTTLNLANELVSAEARVVVWTAQQKDEEKAKEITISYETGLKIRCASIEQRLVSAQQHLQLGHLGLVDKMKTVTIKLIKEVQKISETFNPPWLGERIAELEAMWKEIHGGN